MSVCAARLNLESPYVATEVRHTADGIVVRTQRLHNGHPFYFLVRPHQNAETIRVGTAFVVDLSCTDDEANTVFYDVSGTTDDGYPIIGINRLWVRK